MGACLRELGAWRDGNPNDYDDDDDDDDNGNYDGDDVDGTGRQVNGVDGVGDGDGATRPLRVVRVNETYVRTSLPSYNPR